MSFVTLYPSPLVSSADLHWQMQGVCRVVADTVIFLRVAAVLAHGHGHDRVYVIPDFPLDSVDLGGNRSHGGVANYILAKSM